MAGEIQGSSGHSVPNSHGNRCTGVWGCLALYVRLRKAAKHDGAPIACRLINCLIACDQLYTCRSTECM